VTSVLRALSLSSVLRAQLDREARAAHPRECCGLIEGVRDGDVVNATALHPTRNLATEPDRFEIDPAAHFALMRGLRGTASEIVGCYHSHPEGTAQPSQRDHEGSSEEGFVWLIAATRNGASELRAFVREGGGFRALMLA